jgi:hypothetical protein
VFAGLTIHHQMWFSDPGAAANVTATNGMQETFE